MYLGRYTLGQFAPLVAVASDGAFTPGWPAAVPTFAVYDSTGARVAWGKMPPLDPVRLTGGFASSLRLSSVFAAGHYLAIVDWTLGGTAYRESIRFEVVGGGNADGGIVSLHHYRRPHADFAVGRLDSNQRIIGRGPSE